MISTLRTARRFGLAATILIGGLALGTLAQAASIPVEALEQDQKSCVAACVGRGKAPEKCTAACACSAKAYGEQLTLQEYMDVSNAVKAGTEPPKDALQKMIAIGRTCSADLQ